MPKAPREIKVPVGPNRELKDAVVVEVIESKEPWSEYQLSDGTTVKIKNVLLEISRIKDEYDQEGNPAYAIKAGNIMNVTTPDELKKKA